MTKKKMNEDFKAAILSEFPGVDIDGVDLVFTELVDFSNKAAFQIYNIDASNLIQTPNEEQVAIHAFLQGMISFCREDSAFSIARRAFETGRMYGKQSVH